MRGLITAEQAVQGFAAIAAQAVKLFPSVELTAQALDLAIRHRRAVYDCLYLALALTKVANSSLRIKHSSTNSWGLARF